MREWEREKWQEVYTASLRLLKYDPWSVFHEKDPFLFLMEDQETYLYFSFLLDSLGQAGIACYVGSHHYAVAREKLFGPNPKKEPVFFTQNAIIGIWDDRKQIPPASYRIIKELGLPFRGKGSWLHFEAYTPGRLPRPLNDRELELLAAGLGNLFMMVKGLHESHNLDLFAKDCFPLRTYDPTANLYRLHPLPNRLLPEPEYPRFVVEVDEPVRQLQDTPQRAYNLELDWSYLPSAMKEGRTKFFPRLILACDAASGHLHVSELVGPSVSPENALLNVLATVIEENGKPKKLYVCEEELEAILADFCQKIELPLVRKKKLQQTPWARNYLLQKMEEANAEAETGGPL